MKSRIGILYLYFFFVISLLLILAAGLRSGGDPDYANYRDIYSKSLTEFISVEPFYLYINVIFNQLNIPFEFLIFSIALISIILKCFVFYKRSPYYLSALFIYICTIFIQFDLIAIRQGLAISFVMLAFFFINNRALSILMVLVASLFHASALIIIPILFLAKIEYKEKYIFSFYIAVFLMTLFKVTLPIENILFIVPGMPLFILEKLKIYSSYADASILSYKQLLILLFSILVYFYYRIGPFIKYMCVLYWFGCIISVLFSQVGDIAYRLKWYFLFAEIFFVPVFIYQFPVSMDNKSMLKLIKKTFLITVLALLYLLPSLNFIDSIHERNRTLIF